jgi:hypothetical protein
MLIGDLAANTAASGKMFVTGPTVNTTVDAAWSGGTEAGVARGYLRTSLVMTAEFGATASAAFPYLNT